MGPPHWKKITKVTKESQNGAKICSVFEEDKDIILRGNVVQSAMPAEASEGRKAYKFMAIVLDDAICFRGTDEKIRFVAGSPIPMRWLGHYVSARGKMEATGDGWYLSVQRIDDAK
jgi:hypothetical protein